MSKDGIKGAVQKNVGAAKQAAGAISGDKKLEARGAAERATGAVRESVGKAKDAIRKELR